MKNIKLVAILAILLVSITGPIISLFATGPATVELGLAGNFAILSKAAITDIPSSIITGNIGASPISGTAIGVTCAEVTGTVYSVDAAGPSCKVTSPTLLTTAVSNMETAYTDAAGRTSPTATELGAGDISGLTIAPGTYKWSTSVAINTDVTLSGSANDVWIFQIAGNLDIASGGNIPSGIKVILTGGANPSNIFWQVGGGNGATLGTYSTFNGTILSATQVILQTGAVLNGRALAQTQVTMNQNTVTIPSITPPTLTSVNIVSNNSSGSLAKPGDLITLSFTGSKSLTGVTATIGGQSATVSGSTSFWQAYRSMTGTDSVGNIAFSIDYMDLSLSTGSTITGTTDSSNVYFQKNSPQIELNYSPSTLTGGVVVATITGTGSNPAITFSGSNSHTFTDNGSYTFFYYDLVGNIGFTGSTVNWIDKTGPTINTKSTSNLSQTGVNVNFSFTEINFSTGTSSVIVYTGGISSNFAGTGVTSTSFSSGNGTGTSIFNNLISGTNYTYLIKLTDNVGNNTSSSGTFSTPVIITFSGGTNTQSGAVSLTGSTISTGSTFNLNGTTLTISGNPNDSGFLTGSLSISGTNITVTGSTAWDGILIPPTLIDNNTSESATGSEIGSGITVTQTIKVGAEGASLTPSTSTGYFDVGFVVNGYSSGTVLDLYRSDNGIDWTRVSPDGSCTLNSNSICSFRTDHLSFFAPVIDSTPNSFTFSPTTSAELNTDYISVFTVSGINTGSIISISGGQYKIGTGSYTSSTGTVVNNDIVTVKNTSTGSYSTLNSVTLTIGGISSSFSVTTKALSNGGGGGGGSSHSSLDYCKDGDLSGSYYDGKCSNSETKTIVTSTGLTNTGITTTNTGITDTGTTTIKNTLLIPTGTTPTGILNPTGTNDEKVDIIISDDSKGITTEVVNNITGEKVILTDISHSFAKSYIEILAKNSMIDGYDDNTFKPESNITRAEFLKIVLKSINEDYSELDPSNIVFTDIDKNSWQAKVIKKSIMLDVISTESKTFRPNDFISRGESIKMLLKAKKIKVSDIKSSSFTDVYGWAIKYVETAKKLGIINGNIISGKLVFKPFDNIKRSEVAKIIVKSMDLK